MATASNSDDNISCSLCLKFFDKPRVFSCGHSFCLKCLQNYISTNYNNNDTEISCPFCRQNVHIPDSTKPVETWAAQFSINKSLVDAINKIEHSKFSKKGGNISILSSVSESLKSFKEILQTEMDDKIEQLRQAVNITVVDTTEEVRRIGNTLIIDFTAAVHKEQDRLIREIEKSQNFVNSEIGKLFSEHKHLIDENEKFIKLGENLIKEKSESDMKKKLPKFTELQNTTSKFLSNSLSQIEKAEFKINLRKSDKKKEMSVHIGEITTNIHTDTEIDRVTDTLKLTDTINTETQHTVTQIDKQTDTLKHTYTINTETQHTVTQIDKQTDTLKHTDTINTKTQKDKTNPVVSSILVSSQDKSKIVVSDGNNECVKCFCLERKSLINKHVTSTSPYGLAESRDQQGDVVVVLALPDENKILFLNLENFKLIKTMTTGKQYKFIAVLPGNRFAVTEYYSQCLDILTASGQLINSISTDLIPSPYRFTVHDQCLIVVSRRENENSLFCVTSSGDVKWESRDSDKLRVLRGVTCDREGNIFVCDLHRKCVVQFSRDGNITRDILTDQDGLSEPWCVCCDDNKLYVEDNDEIKIFTWCKK